MLKILVLEDEQEKTRLIYETLLGIEGIADENVDHCMAAVDAKRLLKERHYDLLILDINVPLRLQQAVTVGGGLDVLRAIRERLPGINPPGYVIGLTAYDSGFATASDDFANPLWKLVRFSYDSRTWREQLVAAASYIVAHSGPPYPSDGSTYHVPLGIVVGLEDVELESVLALDASFKQIKVDHDPVRYFVGTLRDGSRSVDVIVGAAPQMGMPVAAVVATKLIETFRPRNLAMCGICAGVRSKTKIGDILVADPCWDWGSMKLASTKSGDEDRQIAPYPWRLPTDLRAAAKTLGKDSSAITGIYEGWTARKPRSKPRVLIDAVASGAAVVQRKQVMDEIRRQHKNLIGVEMEIFAVLTAGALASAPTPRCIGVKAVCDFGDERKTDYAQKYAAYTSANFLKLLALGEMSDC